MTEARALAFMRDLAAITDEQWSMVIACPRCRAPIGKPCARPHAARIDAMHDGQRCRGLLREAIATVERGDRTAVGWLGENRMPPFKRAIDAGLVAGKLVERPAISPEPKPKLAPLGSARKKPRR